MYVYFHNHFALNCTPSPTSVSSPPYGVIIPITPSPTILNIISVSSLPDTGGGSTITPWVLVAVFATLTVILSVALTVTLVKCKKQAPAEDSKPEPASKFEMEENTSYAHCGHLPQPTEAEYIGGTNTDTRVYEVIS